MTLGANAGQAAFAAALLDPGRSCPGGLRVWNGSDPAARLAVHRNNVISSLIDALADTFPVVQQLVGDAFFRALAGAFARQSPPRSRILAHYGEGFAEFIEQFEPARPLPYLADMARLELARVRAYHAADVEPVSSEASCAALASGDLVGELRLACHPSVSVMQSAHAVASLWSAHQVEGDLGTIDLDQSEVTIVLRHHLDVLVLTLPPGAAEFVTALQRGLGLGAAASAAAIAAPAFDLSGTLALLLGHGAITSIDLPGSSRS